MMNRKYFGTDGIRGQVGMFPITPDFALQFGWALGKVLSRQGKNGKVLIGKDTRNSGYMFETALLAGLSAAGIDGCFLGPIPTPAVAHLTRTLGAAAGIVISASHNPYHDNGIKIFSQEGYKLPDELELQIEQQLNEPLTVVDSAHLGKASRLKDPEEFYACFCKETVPGLSLKGLKIVLDCANGAAYKIAPKLFHELGAEVVGIGVEPNGLNINLNCGSTHPQKLQETVLAEQADLGIALDGDGDRVIMVDDLGAVVDGDQLLFVIVNYLYHTNQFRGGVVGTLMTNFGLELALQKLKIPFLRSKVGDRYVIEALKQNNWILGGESSGHIIYLDATTTGDALISSLLVLSAITKFNQGLYELKQGMNKFPQKLINVQVSQTINLEDRTELWDVVRAMETELEGQGRILLRPSGTEPIIRVMVEGCDFEKVSVLAETLADFVRKQYL
ncbi:MAG: phosphoglucosamine mutase [Gammaproteobacteria bacterium]|nr:phosphoglucosamine mutase [Gammaproteobacteria bacterium]